MYNLETSVKTSLSKFSDLVDTHEFIDLPMIRGWFTLTINQEKALKCELNRFLITEK